jgi:hypothetical protein
MDHGPLEGQLWKKTGEFWSSLHLLARCFGAPSAVSLGADGGTSAFDPLPAVTTSPDWTGRVPQGESPRVFWFAVGTLDRMGFGHGATLAGGHGVRPGRANGPAISNALIPGRQVIKGVVSKSVSHCETEKHGLVAQRQSRGLIIPKGTFYHFPPTSQHLYSASSYDLSLSTVIHQDGLFSIPLVVDWSYGRDTKPARP